MAVPFSNTKLRVPKGFQNILEGLAREVLRSQPKEIYAFGSLYFENLLKVREETGHDPAVHGARLEDRFYNNESFKSPSADPSDPQQQDAALKIQTQFRQHVAAQEVKSLRDEEAAIKIQAGVRGYIDRQKVMEMKNPEEYAKHQKEIQDRLAAREAEGEDEVDIDLNDPEVEKAAIKIQAGFKGFKARKEVSEAKVKEAVEETTAKEEKNDEEEVDIDLTDPEVAYAAVKIQSGFRGHKARQEIQSMKDEKSTNEPTLAVEAQAEAPTEEIDIDLNDPEVAMAATKIQATFKGHKARKEVMAMKQEETEPKTSSAPETEPVLGEDVGKTGPEEEEIDIDLEDPDTEKAALKIQAGFRGYKARKNLHGQSLGEADQTEPSTEVPEEAGAAEPSEKKEEEEIDIDLTDPEVEKAALKIQSGFKGYKVRKNLQAGEEPVDGVSAPEEELAEISPEEHKIEEVKVEENVTEVTTATAAEEIVDIDLNDPDVEKAALKIQAGFKGFKARQEVSARKELQKEVEESQEEKKDEEKQEEENPEEEPKQEEQ